jgi:hypothetical protein
MSEALIDNELSRQVWRSKYQYRGTAETSIEATWESSSTSNSYRPAGFLPAPVLRITPHSLTAS